jgi:hypothetical protein
MGMVVRGGVERRGMLCESGQDARTRKSLSARTRRAWAKKRVLGVLLSNHLDWLRKNVTPPPELFSTTVDDQLHDIAYRERHPNPVSP